MPNSIFSLDRSSCGVEFMTDDALIKSVNLLALSNTQLRQENDVFQLYLGRMQPELLLGLQQAIDALEAKENRIHAVASLMNQRPHSIGSSFSLAQTGVGAAMSRASVSRTHLSVTPTLREPPRIEVPHKVEMASRETEELKKKTVSFLNATRTAKADRCAAIEGLRLSKKDIKLFSEEFVTKLLKDKETTNIRVPAEKFVRFIETMIKVAESEITKMRLKGQALMIYGRRVQARLTQKRELGGTLRPVDYRMLKIETDEKIQRLEKSGIYLSELKGSSATAKSHLINMKNTLQEQEVLLANVIESITNCDMLIKKTIEKAELIRSEGHVAATKLAKLKELRRNVFAPDTLEYLKVKAEVSTLKKDIKMWTRKNHVQHATLVTFKNRIKMLSRRRKSTATNLN